MMNERVKLRNEVDEACKKHSIAASRFGRDAMNDPQFVFRLANYEYCPRSVTCQRVRAYIATLDAKATGQ